MECLPRKYCCLSPHMGEIKGFPLYMKEGGCSVFPHNENIYTLEFATKVYEHVFLSIWLLFPNHGASYVIYINDFFDPLKSVLLDLCMSYNLCESLRNLFHVVRVRSRLLMRSSRLCCGKKKTGQTCSLLCGSEGEPLNAEVQTIDSKIASCFIWSLFFSLNGSTQPYQTAPPSYAPTPAQSDSTWCDAWMRYFLRAPHATQKVHSFQHIRAQGLNVRSQRSDPVLVPNVLKHKTLQMRRVAGMAKDVHLPLCTDIMDDLKQEHEPKRRMSGRVCGFDIILPILVPLPKLCRTFLGTAFGESNPHKWLKVQFCE